MAPELRERSSLGKGISCIPDPAMQMTVAGLAVCVVAVAAAGNPAKVALRAGGVSLTTDAGLTHSKPVAVAADKLLHLLAGDEKKDTKSEKKTNGANDDKKGKEAE